MCGHCIRVQWVSEILITKVSQLEWGGNPLMCIVVISKKFHFSSNIKGLVSDYPKPQDDRAAGLVQSPEGEGR